ncbi:MAG: TetR/AcrR family transcriptional regulator [Bacteroidota bacterium]
MPRTKQFNKEEVLEKAMELFWEKGFHATSIQDLVDHLGINRASLYTTFGGKDALFEQAFALYRETSGPAILVFFEGEVSVKAGFKKLFEHAIAEAVADPSKKGCFVVNTTTALIPGNEKIEQVLCSHRNKVEELFLTLVTRGIQRGEIAPDKNPKAIASYLFTFYNGLRVVSKLDTDPERLRQIVDTGLSVLD